MQVPTVWMQYKYLQVLFKKQHSILLYVLAMSSTRFKVNPHSIIAWMSRNFLLEAGAKSEG